MKNFIYPDNSSSFIPYGRQGIDEEDIQAVVDVLRSDFLTTGPKVAEFEQSVAAFVGAEEAVAVSSGTAGPATVDIYRETRNRPQHRSSCSFEVIDPYSDPCYGVSCGQNAHCDNGECICNAGFEGDPDVG